MIGGGKRNGGRKEIGCSGFWTFTNDVVLLKVMIEEENVTRQKNILRNFKEIRKLDP